jgi:hypothetical protein
MGNSLDEFMYICETSQTDTFYFHNLKFDGEFIIYWLFQNGFTFVKDKQDFRPRTFTTLISDIGLFYSIEICFTKSKGHNNSTKIYDSLKILPFKVAEIAKGFNLPISKLEIDYKENREVGHELTQFEKDYIQNDVKIVALALDVLFKQGLTKMTQGSNALADYKSKLTKIDFFPDTQRQNIVLTKIYDKVIGAVLHIYPPDMLVKT